MFTLRFRKQIRDYSGFRRENRERCSRLGRQLGREDLPSGHHLPPVRQVYGLQGRTEAKEARRIQAHCGVSVQDTYFASVRVQFSRSHRGWCHGGGRDSQRRDPDLRSDERGKSNFCRTIFVTLKFAALLVRGIGLRYQHREQP